MIQVFKAYLTIALLARAPRDLTHYRRLNCLNRTS